jgi:hypothetical protein
MSVLLAACVCANAADPAQPYVKKLDVPTPDTLPAREVEVAMPRPMPAPRPVPAATSAAVSASGMPMVPASDPGNHAQVAAPAPAPVAGKPVVAYATLAQAAKAGVDPLGEHKTASVAAPAPVAASTAFDITRPAGWLAWVQAHRDLAARYALVVAVILAAMFGVSRFLARRNSQG